MAMKRLVAGWNLYCTLLQRYPIRTKSLTSFTIFTTSDIVRQRLDDGEKKRYTVKSQFHWDTHRTLRLSMFYALFHTPLAHYWYILLDHTLGSKISFGRVACKVLLDQVNNNTRRGSFYLRN